MLISWKKWKGNDRNCLQNKWKQLSVSLTEPSNLPPGYCEVWEPRRRGSKRKERPCAFPGLPSICNWFYRSILIRLSGSRFLKALLDSKMGLYLLLRSSFCFVFLCLCLLTEGKEWKGDSLEFWDLSLGYSSGLSRCYECIMVGLACFPSTTSSQLCHVLWESVYTNRFNFTGFTSPLLLRKELFGEFRMFYFSRKSEISLSVWKLN